jgi:hypothetical protein
MIEFNMRDWLWQQCNKGWSKNTTGKKSRRESRSENRSVEGGEDCGYLSQAAPRAVACVSYQAVMHVDAA